MVNTKGLLLENYIYNTNDKIEYSKISPLIIGTSVNMNYKLSRKNKLKYESGGDNKGLK